MQQFKIDESSYKKARKRLLIWSPLLIVFAVGVAILTADHGTIEFAASSLSFTLLYLVVILGFSFFTVFRRQKKMFLTYSVTISNERITREHGGTPPLTISFMEIKEIVKTKKGAFIIRGLQRKDVIFIPFGIENKDELEARLAELAPISSKSQDPVYKHYRSFLGLGAFLMWIAVSIVINKTLVVITGVLSIGLYIWAYYEIQTNNNLSENRKKRSYIYFLFILLVLSTMYTKLANWAL